MEFKKWSGVLLIVLMTFWGSCTELEEALAELGFEEGDGIIVVGEVIVFNTLDSSFDDIRWFVDNAEVSNCEQQERCEISFPTTGTHRVEIQVELDVTAIIGEGGVSTDEASLTLEVVDPTTATTTTLALTATQSTTSSDNTSDSTSTTNTSNTIIDPSLWRFVDGHGANGLNVHTNTLISAVELHEFQNELIAVWQEGGGIYIERYNGDPNNPDWSALPEAAPNRLFDVAPMAIHPDLQNFNNKLYLAWIESGLAYVAVYDSSLPGWKLVNDTSNNPGGSLFNGINTSITGFVGSDGPPKLAVLNNELYAIWNERLAFGGNFYTQVARYNGDDNNPIWTSVFAGNGINYDTVMLPGMLGAPKLASNGITLYALWNEVPATSVPFFTKVWAKEYTGGTNWVSIEPNMFEGLNESGASNAQHSTLFSFNGNIYAAWSEIAPFPPAIPNLQIYVAQHAGGNNWTRLYAGNLGVNVDTGRDAKTPAFAEFNSDLYLMWIEDDASGKNQARVQRFNGDTNNPMWNPVDNGTLNLDSSISVSQSEASLATVNGSLFAAWVEDGQLLVKEGRTP